MSLFAVAPFGSFGRDGGVSETSFWRRGDEVQIFRPTFQIEFDANLNMGGAALVSSRTCGSCCGVTMSKIA